MVEFGGDESPTRMNDEELMENSLILVQQLFAEQRVTGQERDHLKDMIFEDDVKLFGLMRRYSDEDEREELKEQVIAYVKTQIHDVNAEIQEFQAGATTEAAENQVFEVRNTFVFNIF